MPKVTPFLWFDNQAEEAAGFYISIFPNSKIVTMSRYSDEGANAAGMPKGSVMVVSFQLDGQTFSAINGGPHFKFTEAISFMVDCETQAEVDHYWNKLSEGGRPHRCGWLKDKYGLSWQIVPTALPKLMSDPAKASRVMKALLQMEKLDIAKLEAAAR